MRRHEQAGSLLEFHELEVQEHFGGEYNLGVSPRDILRLISPFTYNNPDLRFSQGAIHHDSLRSYVTSAPSLLTTEQAEALQHVSMHAGKTFESSLQSFKLGYLLYVHTADDTDKLCGPLPYDFQDMLNNSPAYGQPGEILELERLAYQEVTTLCEVAEVLYSKFDFCNEVDYLLLRSGIGLAYQHCAALMQTIEDEAHEYKTFHFTIG